MGAASLDRVCMSYARGRNADAVLLLLGSCSYCGIHNPSCVVKVGPSIKPFHPTSFKLARPSDLTFLSSFPLSLSLYTTPFSA
jgi:hypothetical protein